MQGEFALRIQVLNPPPPSARHLAQEAKYTAGWARPGPDPGPARPGPGRAWPGPGPGPARARPGPGPARPGPGPAQARPWPKSGLNRLSKTIKIVLNRVQVAPFGLKLCQNDAPDLRIILGALLGPKTLFKNQNNNKQIGIPSFTINN